MKKTKHSEEKIIGAVKQLEAGRPVKEVARELGVTDQTLYNWKAKFGGMEVSDAKKLRALEEENRRLKEMVADLSLDKAALTTVIRKNGWTCERQAGRGAGDGSACHRRALCLQESLHHSVKYRLVNSGPLSHRIALHRQKAGFRGITEIFAKGTLPGGGFAFVLGDGRVEVYDRARFFTVTGNHWAGQMLDIEEHQADLDWLLTLSPHGHRKVPFTVAGKIPKGNQHNTLVSLAGTMRARGCEYPEI
jgi:putative transposase